MKRLARIPKSGTYPQGFKVGAIHAGIKKNSSVLDLAAISSTQDSCAAGAFTSNIFKAAPVQVDQQELETSGGRGFRSVLINSGCANAVTGHQGIADAKSMLKAASQAGGGSSLCMSTGVIGQLLPIEKISKATPALFERLGSTHDDWMSFAEGIMTTDTFPKLVSAQFKVGDHTYSLAGVAKGAGMICPDMATLLGVVATDAPVSPSALKAVLKESVDSSFNSIHVDGDMSTNDTILALANGAAGGEMIAGVESPGYKELSAAIGTACLELAQLVVRDGEGATKFVEIQVSGAGSNTAAKRIARTVADSALVKTAFYGKDANWGRILCAIGYAGEHVEPAQTSVSFVPTDGGAELPLVVNGEPEQVDEERAAQILELPDLRVKISLGDANGAATIWTCDLSHEYVTINGDYRS